MQFRSKGFKKTIGFIKPAHPLARLIETRPNSVQPNGAQHRRGFTLVELLVVIAIIGTLMALLVPAVMSAMRTARTAECNNNMLQVGKAMITFSTTKGTLPGRVNEVKDGPNSSEYLSWLGVLLPNIEENETWDRIRESGSGVTVPARKLNLIICPEDQRGTEGPYQSFVVNAGYWDATASNRPKDYLENGAFGVNVPGFGGNPMAKMKLDYISSHDGSSKTIMITENAQNRLSPVAISSNNGRENNSWLLNLSEAGDGVVWVNDAQPDGMLQESINRNREIEVDCLNAAANTQVRFARPSSNHTAGVNVAYFDGHSKFLSDSIDYVVYQALMTPYGKMAAIPPNGNAVDPNFKNYILTDQDLEK